MARPGTRLALALSAGIILVAGCGDEDDRPASKPLGEKIGGSVATLVACEDWNPGSRPRKLATIADIRNQVNRDDTGIEAPPLSDTEAMALFDRACKPSYARSFRLYVLYARAAGFAPLLRESEN